MLTEILIISLVALIASTLTLFSGFGLGTILMPALLIFFPIDTAIAITEVVHFLSNILKFILLRKGADWGIVFKFGLPAFVAAFFGAKLLLMLEHLPPLCEYMFAGREMTVTSIKLTIAVLIAGFVLLELWPVFQKINFSPKFLTLGGLLSGFFGGLSGHQGALRSMFLLKGGLTKEAFIATNAVIACLVDFSRISVYWENIMRMEYQNYFSLMICATLAAFAGVFIGSKLVQKVTMRTVQMVTSVMLLLIALLLGSGAI